MFRIALAGFPVFATASIAWATWVTKNIFEHGQSLTAPRFTLEHAVEREAIMRAEFRSEMQRIAQAIESRNHK